MFLILISCMDTIHLTPTYVYRTKINDFISLIYFIEIKYWVEIKINIQSKTVAAAQNGWKQWLVIVNILSV